MFVLEDVDPAWLNRLMGVAMKTDEIDITFVRFGTRKATKDIERLAKKLVVPDPTVSPSYWELAASEFMAALILDAVGEYQERYGDEPRSLMCLASFLYKPNQPIQELLAEMAENAHRYVVCQAQKMLEKGNKEQLGVRAVVNACLYHRGLTDTSHLTHSTRGNTYEPRA